MDDAVCCFKCGANLKKIIPSDDKVEVASTEHRTSRRFIKTSNLIFIGISVVIIIALLGIGVWYVHIKLRKPRGMIYIPAGWFWMGCSQNEKQCSKNEKPYHQVYLDAYYIDKNDVTVDEYTRCVNTGGCTAAACTGDGGDYPRNCVDWNQANVYCQWAGKQLPTEAQWEKAARGTDGRIYPWGNEWDASKACYNQGSTCPVGSYPQGASPYGVMDMAGNVWDWCSDWYGANYYANSPYMNPQGPDSGQYRVGRGGSWDGDYPSLLRSSVRDFDSPPAGDVNLGFRCVRDVSR